MVNGFREIGLDVFEPLGAFYVFPCIKSTSFTSEEFCEKLLFEEKVAVLFPAMLSGNPGKAFIRCSYAYSIEDLKKALARIKSFLDKIK